MSTKADLVALLESLLEDEDDDFDLDAVFVILTPNPEEDGIILGTTYNELFLTEAVLRHTADRERKIIRNTTEYKRGF